LKFISGSRIADATTAAATVTQLSAHKADNAQAHPKAFVKSAIPVFVLMSLSALANAAPTIDMSGVTSVMQTVQTACLLIGAIIVLISLVFSVFSFAGGNIMRGVTGVAGVLFGGLVIGLGPTWITSLTGQTVG
jgi:hypothetical protein